MQRRIDHTHELLGEEIRLRRADPELEEREDVFSMLVQAKDENGGRMGDEELRDELMSLLLAGAESSATTLTWVFDFLLHGPDALARLRSELEREDETYLEAVLHETMRLRPVPHLTARLLASPFEVGGYRLPAGTTVFPPTSCTTGQTATRTPRRSGPSASSPRHRTRSPGSHLGEESGAASGRASRPWR